MSGLMLIARMVPAVFPHDLARHPELAGEAKVYVALEAALDDRWRVFYNRTVKGARRRIDFLLIEPTRGLVALEVKGGMVHAFRGSFRQVLHGPGTRPGQRKRVQPFAQTRKALDELFAHSGIDPATVPIHIAAIFPDMSANAFPWGPSPHLLYHEQLAPQSLRCAIGQPLPTALADAQSALLGRLILALTP